MKTRRFLSLLLSLVMVFSLIAPTTALAAGKSSRSSASGETIVEGVIGGSYTDTTARKGEAYQYTILGDDGSEATVAVPLDDSTDTYPVIEQCYVKVIPDDSVSIENGTYMILNSRFYRALLPTPSEANTDRLSYVQVFPVDNYNVGEKAPERIEIADEWENEAVNWTITATNDGYTIQNMSTHGYLTFGYGTASTSTDLVTIGISLYGGSEEHTNSVMLSRVDNNQTTQYLNMFNGSNGQFGGYSGGTDGGNATYLYRLCYVLTNDTIAAATSGVQGKVYYTEESYAAYKEALAAAKAGFDTADEATEAYNALVVAVGNLEDSGLEAVTFNTSNNNISWQRTEDTQEIADDGTVTTNYVANISYVNSEDSYEFEDVTYPKYTALTWNWSSLVDLINDVDEKVSDVWSPQSDGMSACKFSVNSAQNWKSENFYKISGTFAWPEDYDLSDTTISIASVNDDSYSGIYDYIEDNNLSDYFDGSVIPVNDDVYVVMWVDDNSTSITANNINDYLLFWTGTSGKGIWTRNGTTLDDWARTTPATFLSAMKQGVRAFRNAWPNAVGAQTGLANTDVVNNTFSYMTHTDGWYTITDTSAINSVMRNNYSSIAAGATVHLDLYVANNDGEGMIDELEVTLAKKKVTEADVTVMYYYNEVSENTYLGSSVMTNQTIGSTITLTGGTNASQLDYLKSAATAATKKEMNSGIQMNNLIVQKDSSQNIIRVLYSPVDAKVIYLTAATDSVAWTGNSVTLNEVTVTENGKSGTTTNGTYTLPDGNTLKNAISVVSKTDPGIYDNNFKDASGNTLTYVVENSEGQQVTDTYTIITIPGTLTITYAPAAATYTYDFGVTNKYADTLKAVEQKATVTESSDEVEVSGADVTYTPAAADTGDSVDLTLTFTGNYQVTKNVTFVPATNVLYEENLVTNGADWTLTGTTLNDTVVDDNDPYTVDENGDYVSGTVYGYTNIDAYAESEGFSNGSAYQAELTLKAGETTAKTNGASTFTFTGTGFDLISECGTDTGMLLVKVSDSNGDAVKAYLVDTYFTGDGDVIDAESSDDSILDYQVPVIRNLELTYGTYTVTVYGYLVNTAGAVGGASAVAYGLDEFDDSYSAPVSSGISAEDIVAAALDDLDLWDELDVDDVEVSFMSEDSVLNGGYGNTAAAGASAAAVMTLDGDSDDTSSTDASDVTAYVYIDGFRVYKPLENDAEIYTTDGENDVKYASVYDFIENSVTDLDDWIDNAFVYVEYDGDTETAAIADYKTQGPQNEVYLTPGSGIAFALEGYQEGNVVQLAMKAVGKIDATADEATDMPGTTATEMYYEVPVEYDENLDAYCVVITNNAGSTGILALSGLKISSHITPIGSEALGEKVIEKLDKTKPASFVPKVLTASAPSSVKSGRNATISIQSSTDDVAAVKLFIDDAEDGIELTPTNTKAVAEGKSDVYKYSYVVKTKTLELGKGEHTFTVYAYDAQNRRSAPVTITITVT